MVEIAVLPVNGEVADALVATCAQPADRTHAAARRLPIKRRQRLVARALLRQLLARSTGVPPENWNFRDAAGPSIRAAAGSLDRAVSSAHSVDLVAAAVADGRAIGIDVERHRPERDFDALAAAAFGPAERAAVAAGGAAAFYRIWTLREAIAKASGGGFDVLVDGIDTVADPATRRIVCRGETYDVAWNCHRSGWSLALAVPTDDAASSLDAALRAALARL